MAGTVPFLDLARMSAEVRDEVLAAWEGLLSSGRFIGGEAVGAFEEQWAAYCDTTHAVGVGNGTDALHLTLRALGIGPGDEVIVPANTFVATVEAVVLAGARPRFADVDPTTLLMTAETLEAVVTPACRAVVAVHLYGQMPDMDALCSAAERHGMLVVEDAAQAQGSTWEGRPAGSFGIAGCFSFYPGKNLGAFGDAGAVVTSNDDLAERLRCLRDHGRTAGAGHAQHYQHDHLGMNSRLDAVQAVVLSAKLRRLTRWNERRRFLLESYRNLLDPDVATLVAESAGARGVVHLAVVQVNERSRVRDELLAAGIETGIHYPTPCHLMAPYRRYADRALPVAEAAADRILSLPMYPHLGVGDVQRVCEALHSVIGVARTGAA